jgi:GAF domain-containing protein/HAMP domain-containing protein
MMPSGIFSPRRRLLGSIRSQLTLGFGLLLFLALVIAVLGFQSLNSLQTSVETTLEEASRARELSLEIETEFLLARQDEANFLNTWRLFGFEVARAEYVTSNALHLAQARSKIDEIDKLVLDSSDQELQSITQDTAKLSPFLDAYETAFQAVVDDIEQRSRPDGQESVMYATLNELEAVVHPLANPAIYQLILQIRANEQSYLNTGQRQYFDNLRLQILDFTDLVQNSSPTDLMAGTEQVATIDLLELIERYATNLNELVAIEGNIEVNTTVFREVTVDISELVGLVLEKGNAGFTRSRAQLQAASNRTRLALIFVSGLALGLGSLAAFVLTRRIVVPLGQLSQAAQSLGQGNLTQTVQITGGDELVTLADSFNVMAGQLAETVGMLEQRVIERTSSLQIAAEVASSVTSMLDLDILLPRVVELVRERFDYYYVGLFLVDIQREYAVLRAGTGEPGQEMLAQGWRLRLGSGSMIGRCVEQNNAEIALDVGEAAHHFGNPFLPDTRSEMALPLRARGEVIGAMTVQSVQEAAFDQTDISVMQIVADQVAAAISNARLFQRVEESLEAERRAYGEVTREVWRRLLEERSDLAFYDDGNQIASAGDLWRPEMHDALRTGEVVPGQEDVSTLAIPIKVRDQVVGVIDGGKLDGTQWTQEEIDLLQAMTDQLNVALEGSQLYMDSQRRAARERTIGEVTGRIRESLDIETVLKTTASEIRQALDLDTLVIRLATPEIDAESGPVSKGRDYVG